MGLVLEVTILSVLPNLLPQFLGDFEPSVFGNGFQEQSEDNSENVLLGFGHESDERLILIERREHLVENFGGLTKLLLGERLVDGVLAGAGARGALQLVRLLRVALVLVVRAAVVLSQCGV